MVFINYKLLCPKIELFILLEIQKAIHDFLVFGGTRNRNNCNKIGKSILKPQITMEEIESKKKKNPDL